MLSERVIWRSSGLIPSGSKAVGGSRGNRLSQIGGMYIGIEKSCCEVGMTSSAVEIRQARAQGVTVSDETLTVDLTDGRTISVPLA